MALDVTTAKGLQAARTQTNASFNGQVSEYLIASGYNQNIFRGDLVYISTNGYIQNLYDYNNPNTHAAPGYFSALSLGVFDGCSYQTPVSVNPIDPASPGRQYWPAGTNTLGGVPATCSVITDPQVVYNIQTTNYTGAPLVPVAGNGATQANVGSFASVYFLTYVSNGTTFVSGNTTTGESQMSLNISTAVRGGASTLNLYIDSLFLSPTSVAGQQFNSVQAVISAAYYRQMPNITNVA